MRCDSRTTMAPPAVTKPRDTRPLGRSRTVRVPCTAPGRRATAGPGGRSGYRPRQPVFQRERSRGHGDGSLAADGRALPREGPSGACDGLPSFGFRACLVRCRQRPQLPASRAQCRPIRGARRDREAHVCKGLAVHRSLRRRSARGGGGARSRSSSVRSSTLSTST